MLNKVVNLCKQFFHNAGMDLEFIGFIDYSAVCGNLISSTVDRHETTFVQWNAWQWVSTFIKIY